jgi:hypothetical protein
MESGSLDLPEPCGPHRPVMGLIYLAPLTGEVRKECVFRISKEPPIP